MIRRIGCRLLPALLYAAGVPGRAVSQDGPPERVVPFQPGVLSTVNGLAFTPDQRTLYLSRRTDGTDARGRPRVGLFAHHRTDSGWSAPVRVLPGDFTDYQPVLAPDGTRLYFTSTRPLPGTSAEARQNIWFADRDGEGWGEPRPVAGLVTPGWDGYAVPTRSGRLYFVSERTGGAGGVDIWTADTAADGNDFQSPRNLAAVNSPDGDSDLFVDPDERYLIFHRYLEATRDIDLWIAFRTDGRWGAPRPLDGANGPGWELSPTVSPDGSTLYFQRDGTIYHTAFCRLLSARERRRLLTAGGAGTTSQSSCERRRSRPPAG